MTKDTLQVDKALFLKIAKGYDNLKKQVDHLESHLHDDLALDAPVPKGFFFTASFETPVSPDKQKIYMDQFRFFVCQRSEEHTSELQSRLHLVCRLLLEKKK